MPEHTTITRWRTKKNLGKPVRPFLPQILGVHETEHAKSAEFMHRRQKSLLSCSPFLAFLHPLTHVFTVVGNHRRCTFPRSWNQRAADVVLKQDDERESNQIRGNARTRACVMQSSRTASILSMREDRVTRRSGWIRINVGFNDARTLEKPKKGERGELPARRNASLDRRS